MLTRLGLVIAATIVARYASTSRSFLPLTSFAGFTLPPMSIRACAAASVIEAASSR